MTPARKLNPERASKEAALAAAAQAVAAGQDHLLYLDECNLHLLPTIRAMWMKGPRLRVPTPGTNAKHVGAALVADRCQEELHRESGIPGGLAHTQ